MLFFQTPCCNKVYTCRFCHDENENHPVNRKDVTELVCTNCNTRQKVQAQCENCNLSFGKVLEIGIMMVLFVTVQFIYESMNSLFINCCFALNLQYTCLECKLFDDEDKKQYHCDGCGICRIGGRDKFFHCEKCNMCLPIKLLNKHKVCGQYMLMEKFAAIGSNSLLICEPSFICLVIEFWKCLSVC